MRKILSIMLSLIMLCVNAAMVQAAPKIGPESIVGSWYGQFKEPYYNFGYAGNYDAYMNMDIDSCDNNGNFTGVGYLISEAIGNQHENKWCRFSFKGTLDFETGELYLKATGVISRGGGYGNNSTVYTGTLSGDNMYGIIDSREDCPFSFARVSQWAGDEITEANVLGLIPETLKGQDLSKKVSRAEFAAISVRLYEALADTSVSGGKTPFVDISASENREDIEKAYALNIAVGVSDTEFAPDEGLTREQLATMLCRTIKKYKFEGWTYATDSEYYLDSEGVKKFADDNLISDYAKPSVYYMTKMGIINGIDNSHFAPKNTTDEEEANGYASATREQAIALSLRTYKLSDMWQ